MSTTYDQRRVAFVNYFSKVIPLIFENHPELSSLSLDESDATEKLLSLIRVRENLPIPASEGGAYITVAKLLVELIGNKKIAILPLSKKGRTEWNNLLGIVKPPSTEPKTPEQLYGDVIKTYRENVSEFNQRRRDSEVFRKRSDAAQELGLLRPAAITADGGAL